MYIPVRMGDTYQKQCDEVCGLNEVMAGCLLLQFMKVNNHNKTQFYLDVFNRISHYNHLLEAVAPKPRRDDSPNPPNLSRFDTKLYHSIEQ